jgi:NADH:ubiquinone reductase (H+-translocating)
MQMRTGPHKVLVVGGGYAGVLTALRVARKARTRVVVTLVNEGREFIERVRLPQFVGRGRSVRRDLASMLPPDVRLVLGRVESIDGEKARVTLATGQIEPFDTCVLATGSVAARAGIRGLETHGYDIATAGSAARAREALVGLSDGARVLVCGGGLTAIEIAAELAEAMPRLRIGMVIAGMLGPGLSAKGRTVVGRHLAARGVSVVEHARVTAVDSRGVLHANGRTDADVVLWAGGFRASPLPEKFGLETDRMGRARVDDLLRSISHPHIMVVGDSAAVGEHPLRMGCVTALPMAIHAADGIVDTLAGRRAEPFRFGFVLQCISLGRRSALVQFVRSDDSPRERIISGGQRRSSRSSSAGTPHSVPCAVAYLVFFLQTERWVSVCYRLLRRVRAGEPPEMGSPDPRHHRRTPTCQRSPHS